MLTSTTDFTALNNCEFKLTNVETPVFTDVIPEYIEVLSEPFNWLGDLNLYVSLAFPTVPKPIFLDFTFTGFELLFTNVTNM